MKTLRSAALLLGFLLAGACADREELRAQWFLRLAYMGRLEEAVGVHDALPAEVRLRGPLRYQRMLAELGLAGYGPHYAQTLVHAWTTAPQELWVHSRLEGLGTEAWGRLVETAEAFSSHEDSNRTMRLMAGIRYAGSLVLLKDALRRGGDTTPHLAAFRRATDFCAEMREEGEPNDRGRHRVARDVARRTREAITGLDDTALLEWLRAREERR